MSLSNSEMICLGVGAKEGPSFSISIPWLVKSMLDALLPLVISFTLIMVVVNGV